MQSSNRSPRITDVSWGKLEVEGKAEPYKDAKLFPGGSCEWNWRETGTSHRPGIQIADVQELLEHGAKIVVLSRGMAECLHVPSETLADTVCCLALQQARAKRGGWRLISHDVLSVTRIVGRAGSPLHAVSGQARLALDCEPYLIRRAQE